MKVKIPKTLRSGLLVYEVKMNDNLHWDSNLEGLCNHRTKEIAIDPRSPFPDETLIHEKLEQINWSYALELEHKLLSQLSFAFAEFIKHDLNIEFDWSDIEEIIGVVLKVNGGEDKQ